LLYAWLLVALFVEYARPASVFTFLDFPFFYSAVPLSLLLVTSVAQGLRPMQEIMSDRISKWVFSFFAVVLVSWVFAADKVYATDKTVSLLGYVFLFIMICRIATTQFRIRGIAVTLFLAHAFLLAMNPNALLNPETRNYINGATFLGDGNDFGLSLCILLPLMDEIAQGSKSKMWKVLGWVGALVVVFAIIATQSRGATLGLIAVLAYLWWRSPRKAPATVAIGVLVLAALLYAPSQYFARIQTISVTAMDGSAQGRVEAWKGAIGMGVKNPVLGVGIGQFGARWGLTAHSTYFLVFAEMSFLGLLCVLTLVFGNIRDNSRLRAAVLARAGPGVGALHDSARMLDLLAVAMLGFAVAGAFLSATYYPHIYVLSALMVSGRLIALRHLSAEGVPLPAVSPVKHRVGRKALPV
jgi:putative inorganic carbon (HCO3(-)) transporter